MTKSNNDLSDKHIFSFLQYLILVLMPDWIKDIPIQYRQTVFADYIVKPVGGNM